MTQHSFQELACNISVQQAVAVLREGRVVPNRIVDSQPDEPAEQQIVIDLLHQLALRAHGIKRLQKRGTQQPLWRNRLPTGALVELLELPIESSEDIVHDGPDHA